MACTVCILAPRVAPRLPGKPQTRSSKANSSIVRRLTHLSHWFAPPIPRFGAPAGVGDDRLRSANGIGSASGQSFGGRNRHWLLALSGDVRRQYELKYRAAFGAGRGRESTVVPLDNGSANRQAHPHAVGLGQIGR